ncbi:MAG TPA: hypothetical protein VHB23_13805 [Devosiaceae bacterium]|nr:hypothetical protein [Devosiaceae bacterium]
MSAAAFPPAPPRRFPWIRYLLGFVLIGALAVAPVAIAVMSSQFAAAQGCQVDEGNVHPCLINGGDYGELFYTLGVSGWFILLTAPLGLAGEAVLLIAMIVHFFIRRRTGRQA